VETWIKIANDFRFESMIHNAYNTNSNKWKSRKPMSHAIRKARSLIIRKEILSKARTPVVRKESDERPYRSKLMLCIEILCTLASKGSMNLTQLTHKVQMDKARLIPHLRLLHNRGLVKKKNLSENKIFYVVTERGLKVLKVVSPIIREAHKIHIRNFEVISSTLSGAGYS
jgi:predicted transcriptional regulator